MDSLTVTLTGTRPMLMHNIRLADALNPYTQRLADLQKDKKRKGADKLAVIREVERVEWEGGLYHTQTEPGQKPDPGPYIPDGWIQRSLTEAARLTRDGKNVERGVQIRSARHRLEYDGPRDLDEMWRAGTFKDRRMVTVARARVPRVRPVFAEGWKARVEFLFNSAVVERASLVEWIEGAGLYIGLGDARSIGYGRFEVKFH